MRLVDPETGASALGPEYQEWLVGRAPRDERGVMVPEPGDLMLAHRNGPMSRAVTWGQKLRGYDHRLCYWSHCGIVVEDAALVEALGRGVERTPVSKYIDIDHRFVHTTLDPRARQRVVNFAEHAVGRQYGFTEMASMGLYLASGTRLHWAMDNQLLCSSLAAEALCRTSAIFPKEPLWMLPVDLAVYYGVT